jgi:GNAT superfamily N-acetyltransferase
MTVQFSVYDPSLTYAGQNQFDCEHAKINKFVKDSLKKQVRKNLSVAYVLTDSDHNDRFVGFFTIAQHAIDMSLLSTLELGSLPHKIPCSRLIMLGVDKGYKKQKLGLQLVKEVFSITKTISKAIGGFGLYLDADPGAVNFYQNLGLELLQGNMSPEPSPMFIQLSAIAK